MNDDFNQNLTKATEATKLQLQQDPTLSESLAKTASLQNDVIEIEKELLELIVSRLDQEKMSPEEAQNLAKEFLSLLPIDDQRDLLQKLHKLSQDNRATQGIYLRYAKPHEENEAQRKLILISEHLHKGEIEHALAIAKGDPPHA
jgi:hypothetical protein